VTEALITTAFKCPSEEMPDLKVCVHTTRCLNLDFLEKAILTADE
jgi:hypothetical protein